MAGLRCGRPTCIRAALSAPSTRAGLRRGQRRPPHRLKLPDPAEGERDATTGWATCCFCGCLEEARWGGPLPPDTADVDMQPVEARGPEVPSRVPGQERGPGAAGFLAPVVFPGPRRHACGRARLGSERDQAPRRPLSKRKLELLLVEPEKIRRKKRCVSRGQAQAERSAGPAPGP